MLRVMRGRAQRVARHRAGLAAFEQPRFLHLEPLLDTTGATSVREQLRGRALVARTVFAAVLVVAAPLLDQDWAGVTRFAWFVGLVWVPTVGLADLLDRRWHRAQPAALEVASDAALCLVVHVVLDAPAPALVGYVLLVAWHAYVGGRAGAARAVLTGVVGTGMAIWLDHPVDPYFATATAAAAVLLATLLADASQRHASSRAGLVQVSERAAAILAGIADAVVVTAPSGRVQEWNPAAARLFAGPEQVPNGAHCAQLLGLRRGLRPLACDSGCALLAADPEARDLEVVRIDAHGHRQPLLASAAAVMDRDGHPIEVIHSFRDITALKAAEEAKTLFLATTSHELRTPLTVIRGFARMLQQEDMPVDQRQPALAAISRRAEELSSIVDRLLMSSRIDAGRIELSLRHVHLGDTLTERASAVAGSTGRRVRTELPAHLPEVHADLDAVATVIDHLLENAVKYSPDGGPVTLSAAASEAGDAVVVSVTDVGIGMSPEQLEHAFDRFWQAEASHVRRFGGTGIGLYIVRSLVDAMGGRVEVHSEAGEGTTFRVVLRTEAPPQPRPDDVDAQIPQEGEQSMIREYMRQVGVPLQRTGGAG